MSMGSNNIRGNERERLEKDIQTFLTNGGKIIKLPYLLNTSKHKSKKEAANA